MIFVMVVLIICIIGCKSLVMGCEVFYCVAGFKFIKSFFVVAFALILCVVLFVILFFKVIVVVFDMILWKFNFESVMSLMFIVNNVMMRMFFKIVVFKMCA